MDIFHTQHVKVEIANFSHPPTYLSSRTWAFNIPSVVMFSVSSDGAGEGVDLVVNGQFVELYWHERSNI